jgi:hypothetical protein
VAYSLSVFEINADFKSLVSVLSRIADALDRAYPPATIPLTGKAAGPENLTVFDIEAAWQAEQEEERRTELGLPPQR